MESNVGSRLSIHVPGVSEYSVVIHMFLSGIAAVMDLDSDTMDDLQLAGDESYAFLLQDMNVESVDVTVEDAEKNISVTYTGNDAKNPAPQQETIQLMQEMLEVLTLSFQISISEEKRTQITLVVPKAV